jgi:MraZ protein
VVKSGNKGAKVGILGKPYFRGQSINRLDSKGRLRIPTKFREVLQNHYTDALIITTMDKCLVAYPPELWDTIETRILSFSQVQPEQRNFVRIFISGAVECEFDNQGRILIPPVLRERAKLEGEVLLAGMLTSFEIWNKEVWDRQMEWNTEHYQQIATHIADIGL